MKLPSLTPPAAKVTAVILARKDVVEATPLRDVALKSALYEAMVVNFARKLGCTGLRDCRLWMIDYDNSDTAAFQSEISEDDTAGEIVKKMFRAAMHALEESFGNLDLQALECAADHIARACQRDFYGLGGSAQIARDDSHNVLRIGIPNSEFDDAHIIMPAALLGPDDAAIDLFHSGAISAVLDAAEMARRNGARTIAVTKEPEGPLARITDDGLCSKAQNSPLLGENAPVRIAQLGLLDAPFVAVAQRAHKSADENLGRHHACRSVQPKNVRTIYAV